MEGTDNLCGEREWYVVMPRSFLISDKWKALTPSERAVFNTLYMHANKEQVCWPSTATIADLSGMKPRNTRRCLCLLEEKRYIEIDAHYKRGQQTSNRYTLLVWPMDGVQNSQPHKYEGANMTAPPCKIDTPTPANIAGRTVSTELHQDTTTSMPVVVQSAFQDEDQSQDQDKAKDFDNATVTLLKSFGVSDKKAIDLAQNYPDERIQEKARMLGYQENVVSQAGWLVTAIEQDYLSEETVFQRQRAEVRAKHEEQKVRQEEEREQRRREADEDRQRTAEMQAFRETLPDTVLAEVRERALERIREKHKESSIRIPEPYITATENDILREMGALPA